MCRTDSGCKRRGFTCEQGRCTAKSPGPRCGAKRCKGKTPFCCWNADKRSGYCAETECKQPGDMRYACTSAKECGGVHCTVALTFNEERNRTVGYGCAPRWHATSGALCTTVNDCPPIAGKATGCKPSKELPPGVKECTY